MRLNSATFPTLGVEPILGRVFTPQEEDTRQSVTVISYALWTNRYHRDPRVLGSTMILDRKPYSVIGVMPRDFEFPLQPGRLDQTQVWVPLSLTPDELSDQHSGFWGYHMIARLSDGVTLSQGAKDADRVAHQIMRDFPASMSAIQIQGDVEQLRETVVADVRIRSGRRLAECCGRPAGFGVCGNRHTYGFAVGPGLNAAHQFGLSEPIRREFCTFYRDREWCSV